MLLKAIFNFAVQENRLEKQFFGAEYIFFRERNSELIPNLLGHIVCTGNLAMASSQGVLRRACQQQPRGGRSERPRRQCKVKTGRKQESPSSSSVTTLTSHITRLEKDIDDSNAISA